MTNYIENAFFRTCLGGRFARSVIHYGCFLIALCLIGGAFEAPAWADLPIPNQPILVVQDSTSSDPYQYYVPELLTTEGLNGSQVAQLSDLTDSFVANYDVVILPHLTLNAAQATLFRNYVNAGGTLIGFRPDLQLADLFGVSSLSMTLPEGWVQINTMTPYGSGLESQALKFHGTADLYALNGASALAILYQDPATPISSPAASIYTFGLGKAILFTFDLTQSIVLMRQGNPAWAGYPNSHDGYGTMRPSQMFMDAGTGAFWNDLGDSALNDVPQADEQLRLFSNTVVLTNAAKRPLPRFWYFPNQSRSLFLMTGDDHGFSVANAQNEIDTISSFGGLFSYNLWYPYGTISNSQVNTWLAAGYSMGVHFNDTAETDPSGIGGSQATWNGMQSVMSTALSSFATTYPGAPFPATTRNHFLIWVSNDADGTPDQVAQAKLFQNFGIQMDTTYSSFPKRWSYMTGSGLPMKFLDTASGSVIPVYEQATQYEDDVQLQATPYGLSWDAPTAQAHYLKSLSDSLNKYNTVVTMLFHPENWNGPEVTAASAALQYAQNQSIPIATTGAWLSFWQGRAATGVSNPSFTASMLTFTATGSPTGLTLLVPDVSGTNVVTGFNVDGAPQSYGVAAYQGIVYASVVLTAGTHNISVAYSPAGRILGQISPNTAAASATVQVQGGPGGSIAVSVQPAADGTYAVGPLPAGTYAVTPTSSSFTFAPASQSISLGSADVTGVNFMASSNPANAETLFTTQIPALVNLSDGPGANYELGTALTSDIPGYVTAIRFWKASNETGTHTGNLWTASGTLLATATFESETSSGWQQQNLSSPVPIDANTPYVVSVNTGNSFYVATPKGLLSPIIHQDLSSVVGNNGVLGSPGNFPSASFNHNSYFRDIVFTANISKTPTITWTTPAPVTYGTALGAAQLDATADVPGSFSYSPSAGTVLGAGTQNLSVTFTPTDMVHYTTASASVALTVNPQTTSTTLSAGSTALVYGQALTLTATVTPQAGGAISGSANFFDGTAPLTSVPLSGQTATYSVTTLGVGTHTLTVAYSGDSNSTGSTSPSVTVTVSTATSSSSVTSSVNPSYVNQAVTFTATVAPQFSGTPSGTVTFRSGTTALGTAPLVSGQAVFLTSTLTAGTKNITAVYSGDSNFAASTSPAFSQVVQKLTSTTTTITTSGTPSISGQTVTFTATVSSASGTPPDGELVTFSDGSAALETAPLAGGVATYSTSTLVVGVHTMQAAYAGDVQFGADSGSVTQRVNAIPTTTTVVSSLNPSLVGQAVTFTATVSSAQGIPPDGELITFRAGGTAFGTAPLVSGQAVFTTSTLAAGTKNITAVYPGDSSFATSTSPALSQVVQKVATTTTITTSGTPSIFSQTVTFTATVGSASGAPPDGELITLSDGSAALGTAPLAGGVATFSISTLAIGSHTMHAAYAGDLQFGSSSGSVTQRVNGIPTTTTVVSSLNPSLVGQAVTFTATVSSTQGIPPDGELITFRAGGTAFGTAPLVSGQAVFTTSTLAAGTKNITAVYPGDSSFATSTSPALSQVVQKVATTTTITTSGTPSIFSQTVTFTAMVGSASGAPPDGELITFSNGSTALGTVPLSGGVATFSISTLVVGSHTMRAAYAGDLQFGSSSGSVTQRVNGIPTTTTVASNLNPSFFGQAVTFTATVSSAQGIPPDGELITFRSGTTALGTAPLVSGQAVFTTSTLTAGTKNITAVYPADSSFATSTSPVLSQSVTAAATSITLTSSLNPSTFGQAVTLTATVSSAGGTPTGTVTFRSGGTNLGTITLINGVASVTISNLARGNLTETGTYNGNASYSTSTASLTQVVN